MFNAIKSFVNRKPARQYVAPIKKVVIVSMTEDEFNNAHRDMVRNNIARSAMQFCF